MRSRRWSSHDGISGFILEKPERERERKRGEKDTSPGAETARKWPSTNQKEGFRQEVS